MSFVPPKKLKALAKQAAKDRAPRTAPDDDEDDSSDDDEKDDAKGGKKPPAGKAPPFPPKKKAGPAPQVQHTEPGGNEGDGDAEGDDEPDGDEGGGPTDDEVTEAVTAAEGHVTDGDIDEDIEAKAQALDPGDADAEPPEWVEDKALWTRVRDKLKARWADLDEPWEVVACAYEDLGGGVGE